METMEFQAGARSRTLHMDSISDTVKLKKRAREREEKSTQITKSHNPIRYLRHRLASSAAVITNQTVEK